MLQFLRTACALLVELGDKSPHAMRWDDADAQYSDSVNDVMMKGSPQGTSSHGVVIVAICHAYAIFQ
jgi:LDH2 family malate/lactate/ureidoglycolate dehydrogenase